ncbi:hypothetical protein SNOG_05945 [Parastagonospora nodorum SN15]|uniref:Uncharacterized protein n=1 Tax=Phaeosphaeria nodorum (strain SN15 / ATCC MYA-4574 / FGSC 10173) TaxID=321614 RepID=Q0UQL9_PHANO|nr:hypothetical protein SNOG_05945 [Parastagonospora nodorum SN15]EAT87009.1 hypothetical protein SNOG_05945 [Parastagonospora nodorum SN15]
MTSGVVVARSARGLLIHKVKFGADDKSALVSIFLYIGAVTLSKQRPIGRQYRPELDHRPTIGLLVVPNTG